MPTAGTLDFADRRSTASGHHRNRFAQVVIDRRCRRPERCHRRFVVNAGTDIALMKWCQRWPERRYAIEGAKGLGRGIVQILVARGEDVVDVPSTLAMKVRVLSTGGGRKTDPDDVRAVALTALYHRGLHQVNHEDQSTILWLLSECRDSPGRGRVCSTGCTSCCGN